MTRFLIPFFSLSLAAAAGCAALGAGVGFADEMGGVPEIRPGVLKGYLPKEAVPDSAVAFASSAGLGFGRGGPRSGGRTRESRAARHVSLEARQHGRRP